MPRLLTNNTHHSHATPNENASNAAIQPNQTPQPRTGGATRLQAADYGQLTASQCTPKQRAEAATDYGR